MKLGKLGCPFTHSDCPYTCWTPFFISPSLLQVGATVRLRDLATNWSLGLRVLSLAKREQLSVSCYGLSQPSNVIRGRKQIFSSSLSMAFPFNTVPGPQRTEDYAVMPWRSGPLALHTCRYEVFNISFHRSGRLSVSEKCLLAKRKLETAFREDNNRIILVPAFLTFDSFTIYV